ncbi:MAG: carbohydrate ABC transporter permease [Brachybacterium tyrofermentans]|uniref:carbohydrate ABC transporter permease n=1 Tax=Brachybacterium tyrofermentans TaxID=47848 RepID=UPI001D0312DE|nr:sugar ABC transporter permease [Brachybacterium tyrofermentans]
MTARAERAAPVRTRFPFPRRGAVRLTFGLGMLMLVLFAFVPAVAVIVVSFTDLRGLTYVPTLWVGIENYLDFFSPARAADNWNALRNTMVFAIVGTVLQMGFALAISLLLNRPLRGRNFFRAVVFMPTILGVTVGGLIWSLIFNPAGGPMQSLLHAVGTQSAFFGDPRIALGLVIFVHVWMQVGISVVIFLAGLQAIPAELQEVASIDGASAWQRFRNVTFPLLAPSLTANVLMGVVNAMHSYQLTYVLAGPSNRSTQVLSLLVYVQAFGGESGTSLSQSQGYAAAIATLQFVLVGVIALATLFYLRRREARL